MISPLTINLNGPLFIDHKLPPFDPLAHFCHNMLLSKNDGSILKL